MIRAIFRTRVGRAIELGAEFAHDLVRAVIADRLRRRLGIDKLEHAYWDMHDRVIALEQARLEDVARRRPNIKIAYGDDFADDSPRKRSSAVAAKVAEAIAKDGDE